MDHDSVDCRIKFLRKIENSFLISETLLQFFLYTSNDKPTSIFVAEQCFPCNSDIDNRDAGVYRQRIRAVAKEIFARMVTGRKD